MKLPELHLSVGKRVKINGAGDFAINHDMKQFIYDDDNKHYLVIDRITKGGMVIVRHGKHTYSIPPKNVDLFTA